MYVQNTFPRFWFCFFKLLRDGTHTQALRINSKTESNAVQVLTKYILVSYSLFLSMFP